LKEGSGMTDREKVAALLVHFSGVQNELYRKEVCKPCVAVKLARIKSLFDLLYSNYEGYLD
jgi:hypothetical protein